MQAKIKPVLKSLLNRSLFVSIARTFANLYKTKALKRLVKRLINRIKTAIKIVDGGKFMTIYAPAAMDKAINTTAVIIKFDFI